MSDITLSHYQKDFLKEVEEGTGSIVLSAVAGSGKTFTSILASSKIPKGKRAIFLAFNKHIVDEMKTKLPSNVEARTCHSLAYKPVAAALRGHRLNVQAYKYHDLADPIIKRNYGAKKWQEQRELKDQLIDLVNFARNTLSKTDEGSLMDMASQYGLDIKDDALYAHVPILLEQGIEIFQQTGIIDYTDMIWLVTVLGLTCPKFDYIFVDEAQDLNALQHDLLTRVSNENTRIFVVGDEMQCQPENTFVSRKIGAPIPISEIEVGQQVLSFIPNEGRYATGTVKGIACRHYEGDLIHVNRNHKTTACTPEHKFFVRWNKRCYEGYYCVYLMQFDNYFRIGKTKLLQGGGNAFGLTSRMRTEGAHSGWILKICTTEKEALIQETILSCKFQIPTLTFREGIYGQNHKYKIMFDQAAIDYIFMEIGDKYEHANQLLNSLGMRINIPFAYRGSFKKMGKTTTFLVNACNIFPQYMCLPSTDILFCKSDGTWANMEKRFPKYSPITSCRRSQFKGSVFSLDIDRGTYIADGIPTHNSMYGFTGALSNSLALIEIHLNAKKMPLSICYRCPKKHLELARHVDNNRTEWRDDAPDGVLEFILQKDIDTVVQKGDLILCRLTAPLIGQCIRLIAKGVPAKVLGRNIGKSMISMINQIMDNDAKWEDFVPNMEAYENTQIEKLRKRKDGEYQVEFLRDKVEALAACYKSPLFDTTSESAFRKKIESLFSDDQTPITLCTVHRAKGLEADNVFIINDSSEKDCMPLIWKNQQPWQIEQECNIIYVALTRAKKALYICSSTQKASERHKNFYLEGGIRGFTGKKKSVTESPSIIKSTARHPETLNTVLDQDENTDPICSMEEGFNEEGRSVGIVEIGTSLVGSGVEPITVTPNTFVEAIQPKTKKKKVKKIRHTLFTD